MIATKERRDHKASHDLCAPGVLSRLAESLTPSIVSKQRMLTERGEPLFVADWVRVLMMHFEVDAAALQRQVPFQIDLWDGRAFLTLVAFTMENMRPRRGGKLGALLFRPIATHDFLNVRTYVRHHGEPGIHFLAEWLSSWLAVQLGPATFALPYRHGRINYNHEWQAGHISGSVEDRCSRKRFAYAAEAARCDTYAPCDRGSLDEWLMERYAAFNAVGDRRRFFRVWHSSWPQTLVRAAIRDTSLIETSWPWFEGARLTGANYSPGLKGVCMGRPHRIKSSCQS